MTQKKKTILKPVSVSERIDGLEARFSADIVALNSEVGKLIDDHWASENKKRRQKDALWLYVLIAVYVIFIAVYTYRTFQRR